MLKSKRVLSMVLVVLMMLSLVTGIVLPAAAEVAPQAEDDPYKMVTDGATLIETVDGVDICCDHLIIGGHRKNHRRAACHPHRFYIVAAYGKHAAGAGFFGKASGNADYRFFHLLSPPFRKIISRVLLQEYTTVCTASQRAGGHLPALRGKKFPFLRQNLEQTPRNMLY